MDSKNQFQIFCLSVLAGFVGGVCYEIFALFRSLFGCERGKNKFAGGAIDLLYYIFLAIFYIFTAHILHFPAFRVYLWVGFALGGAVYLKSLRRMVAFLKKICYNKVRNSIKARKKLSKREKKTI